MSTDNVDSSVENITYDEDVIKKIIANSISNVSGVLALSGSLINDIKDSISSHDLNAFDPNRGISVKVKGSEIICEIKLIAEYGKNVPDIAHQITENVTKNLSDMTGLGIKKLNVKVDEFLSVEDFTEKYKIENTSQQE